MAFGPRPDGKIDQTVTGRLRGVGDWWGTGGGSEIRHADTPPVLTV